MIRTPEEAFRIVCIVYQRMRMDGSISQYPKQNMVRVGMLEFGLDHATAKRIIVAAVVPAERQVKCQGGYMRKIGRREKVLADGVTIL